MMNIGMKFIIVMTFGFAFTVMVDGMIPDFESLTNHMIGGLIGLYCGELLCIKWFGRG